MNILTMIVQLLQAVMQPLNEIWSALFRIRLTDFWVFDSLGNVIYISVVFVILLAFALDFFKGGND